jgi:hypothetical protein
LCSSKVSATQVRTTKERNKIDEIWFDDIIKKGFDKTNEYSSKESSLISEVSSTNNKTKSVFKLKFYVYIYFILQ